jgi:O-antigen/teichoic acid export membrane protein
MFLKDVVGVFNSNVFSLVCGLLLSVLLTRELGPEGFGLFTSLLVIPIIVVSITNMGVRGASIYLIGRKKYNEREIISTILFLLALSSITGIVISYFAYMFYDDPKFTMPLIGFVLVVIPFRLGIIYIEGIFIGKDEIRQATRLYWPINLINLALAAILVWGMKYDVTGAVLATLLANVAVSVYAFNRLLRIYKPSFYINKHVLKELFLMGILFSASFFIIQLNYRVDIVLLEKLKGLEEVGLYSLGVNIGEQLWQIPLAISVILFSRTANLDNPSEMTATTVSLARISLIIAVLVSALMVVVAPWIIPVVFGEDFAGSVLLLQVVLPGIIIMVIFRVLSGQLAGMGKPQLAIYIFVPALVLNIALNFLLIPRYDGLGAAIATNISYVFGATGYWILFARHCGTGYGELFRFTKQDFLIFKEILRKIRKHETTG